MSEPRSPAPCVMGLFTDEDAAATAISDLRESPFTLSRVHGPYPSHRVMDALRMKLSKVGYFTLTGGILGFVSGYALTIYSSVQWSLIVGGKPIVALIPFFVVGYELTILFGVLGTVLGLLLCARLPRWRDLKDVYDPRCSGVHFGIVATFPEGRETDLIRFFTDRGAETRSFAPDAGSESGGASPQPHPSQGGI